MPTIYLQIKRHYGQKRIYAQCQISKTLLQLTGRKTFTSADILVLRNLGYTIHYISETE